MAGTKWTTTWPRRPGIYLFYGYIINKEVEALPRLHLVTVEYVSTMWGAVYRTSRYTIKKESGAYGMWCPLEVPDLPNASEFEEKAIAAAKAIKPMKPIDFIE